MTIGAADSCLLVIDELRRAENERLPIDLTLSRIASLIANGFETDVASIYRLELDGESLLLAATVGLLQSCVGRLRMQTTEGLVGLVAERKAPLSLADAPQHPRFKYFPEADEDRYHSFLGVPVIDNRQLRGALVVQTIEPRTFSEAEELNLLRTATLLTQLLDADAHLISPSASAI